MVYVDVGAKGDYPVSFPIYYRQADETLAEISQRYLDVIKKLDPALQSASVMGFNAILRVGRPTGMVLSALGCQVTEAEDLLTRPKAWLPRIEQVSGDNDELLPALAFFRQYAGLPSRDQERL